MKTCPYCAEEIQDAAIICRFCGRDQPVPPSIHPSIPETKPKGLGRGAKILIGIVAIILAFVAIGYVSEWRHLNASVVRIDATGVDQLLLIDRPIPLRPATDVDFEYTGFAKDGSTCNVLDLTSIEGEIIYEVNCAGVIGWITQHAVDVVR